MDHRPWRRLTRMLAPLASGWKLKNRLLVSLILLSSIPVAITAIVSSLISNRIIGDQTDQMHQVFLNQVEKEMNEQFKKFDELMLQYTYANSALGRFTQEDLTYQNFRLVNDLYSVLTNLRSGMENVAEIDFYSIPYGKIVTSGGSLIQPSEFLDPVALRTSLTLTQYGAWIDTRNEINARLKRPVITFIRPTYHASSEGVKGVFIVYLDAVSLSAKLKANEIDPAAYLVVNPSGYVVMHSEPAKVGSRIDSPELMAQLAQGRNLANNGFTFNLDGKPSLINAVYSGNRDWYYVSILPVALVHRETDQLRDWLLGVSIAFIVVAVVIAIRTSRTIYRPVHKLTQRVFKQQSGTALKDEFHYIADYIQNMEESNDLLKKDVELYLAHAEHYSLMSLLLGNFNASGRAVQLEPFGGNPIGLYLIEVDSQQMEARYSRNDQFLFYFAVENIASEIMRKQGVTRIMMIQPGLFAVLNQPEAAAPRLARVYAGELLHAIQTYLKLNCVISVSFSESGLSGIHDAFLQARHALRYSFTLGANKVIISDELDPAVSGQADALVELENLILQSLQDFRHEEAMERFDQLIQWLRDDITLTPEALKTYCSQLLGAMIHSVNQQPNALMEPVNRRQLTMELEKQRNLREIAAFFRRHFFDKLTPPQSERAQPEKQQVEEVVAYIHAHYDEDISLQLCAELVGLSASQLSRAFKKTMDINFVDYVIQYRIGIAKELLADPNRSIQAVTEKLRYTSVNSFIRIFKKITGTTPGHYRKDIREDL
ncbi:AraC family transcriptional regulator [Cohnella nanjingensis]|uniref:AraC family transcriptional regulator n=1 Tax=Cohnella nanjingensis TaxID=1387779 RepID=A0A7X0RQJ4_9BACL|nr:AraC family transcriptional regulator [Cohnella nanjingensis]MBB6671862.1 AraC family transcriptional regulator [Cohnella nanjingensis]